MSRKIAVLAGDGIGPEIMAQTLRIMDVVNKKFQLNIEYEEAYVGGIAIDKEGKALPEKTINLCKQSDAILFGAVGGPKWEKLPPAEQPERAALLPLRKMFDLYANLRPSIVFATLADASPLKKEILGEGFDIQIVRELTSGIYFGDPKGTEKLENDVKAYDTMVYSRSEITRIAHVAFKSAMKRKKKVTSIDKANVLMSSVLWRDTVIEVSKEYPDVELNHLYVDAAAMKLVSNPREFDVILAGNLFGDILSDEASTLTGSLGMLPSASLADGTFGLYEPAHGSAPDIAGQGIANPSAQILSLAMLLRYTYNEEEAAKTIEQALEKTIDDGFRCPDIMAEGCTRLSTSQFADEILHNID